LPDLKMVTAKEVRDRLRLAAEKRKNE